MRRVDYMVGMHDFKALRADQFMQSEVVSYHVDDTGEKCARAMTEGGFGSVPVVDHDRKVLGIVSEFDLLKVIMQEQPLSAVTAGDIMTPNPITVDANEDVGVAVLLMIRNGISGLPVVRNSKLVGIITKADIVKAIASK